MRRPAWRTCRSYFNPRSPHGERRCWEKEPTREETISIHAPRTGSDVRHLAKEFDTWHFNPRSPHGERLGRHQQSIQRIYFNPRSPHGERPQQRIAYFTAMLISIHAPRTGSDAAMSAMLKPKRTFQSTLPARGATARHPHPSPHNQISIHAPRTGSDVSGAMEDADGEISIHAPRTGSDSTNNPFSAVHFRFQSTLPARGATGKAGGRGRPKKTFQSTLPARGATASCCWVSPFESISIHAPRTGSDASGIALQELFANFNPRSPHGERPGRNADELHHAHFNPRSPHGERQKRKDRKGYHNGISIHAPRTGSD